MFSYLTAIVTGPARTLILSEEVNENPKKAWDALANEYDRRTDMDTEIALGEWYRMSKKPSETGTQFLTRLDMIADRLAKKGKNLGDQAKLAKARECLLMDRRYRHVIEGSLLNENIQYAALRKTIVELDALHNITSKESEERNEMKEELALKSQQNRLTGYRAPQKRRQDGSVIRNGNCSHCGRFGHFAFECKSRHKPQTEERKKVEEEMKKRRGTQHRGRFCQEPQEHTNKQIANRVKQNDSLPDCNLIVDSAVFPTLLPNTCHVENVKEASAKTAKTADGNIMKIEKSGELSVFENQPAIRASIAPTLEDPLLSVPDLNKTLRMTTIMDWEGVRFVKGKVNVKEERVIGEGPLIGGTYRFNPAYPHPNQNARYCTRGITRVDISHSENGLPNTEGTHPKKETRDPTKIVLPNMVRVTPIKPNLAILRSDMENELLKEILSKITLPVGQKSQNQKKRKAKANRKFDPAIEKEEITWHERFGHLSGMERTIKLQAATGIPEDLNKLKRMEKPCLYCIAGKLKQRSYKQSEREHRNWRPGESIQIDIQGPFEVTSLGGARYELEVVDKATGMLFGCPIKDRKDAGDALMKIIKCIERQTETKLKEVICDGAPEFIAPNSIFGIFLHEIGIEPTPSTPYTPNENFAVENAHKTRSEVARTVRIRARLPKQFWAEAGRFGRIVRNMTVPKGKEKILYKLFYGVKPDFSNIHAFGCHAFAWIPKEKRRKLDARARPAIYLGPQYPGKHGHRLYDPVTKTIFTASTVIFDEKSFGLPEIRRIAQEFGSDMSKDILKFKFEIDNIIDDDDKINIKHLLATI